MVTDGKSILHYVRGKKAANSVWCERSVALVVISTTRINTLFAFVGMQAFQEAVKREVCEELSIQGEFNARPVGFDK